MCSSDLETEAQRAETRSSPESKFPPHQLQPPLTQLGLLHVTGAQKDTNNTWLCALRKQKEPSPQERGLVAFGDKQKLESEEVSLDKRAAVQVFLLLSPWDPSLRFPRLRTSKIRSSWH